MHLSVDINLIEENSRKIKNHKFWSFDWLTIGKWSISAWLAKKLQKHIVNLSNSTVEIYPLLDELSPLQQKEMFGMISKMVPFLIDYRELLEKSNYHGNDTLKTDMRNCLDNLYALESGLKRRVKKGVYKKNDSDQELKEIVNQSSKQSLISKM
jgi:hypothetical protein